MGTRSYQDVADGGWGWLVLVGAFFNRTLFAGIILNSGVYMVEWQESFSVGAGAVSVIATELACGANTGGMYKVFKIILPLR